MENTKDTNPTKPTKPTKITLGIPTFRRFDFLKIYLPRYLAMDIDEVLVCDETGEDIEHIKKESWGNHPKLTLIKNRKRLGTYLNKCAVLNNARNDWVAVIDSDNEVRPEFFTGLFEFWKEHGVNEKAIYCPGEMQRKTIIDDADGDATFRPLVNMRITKDNWNSFLHSFLNYAEMALNNMNYVCHKSNYSLLPEDITTVLPDLKALPNIESFPYDAIFITRTLVMSGIDFIIVPKMKYFHLVHDGSEYVNYSNIFHNTIYPLIKFIS